MTDIQKAEALAGGAEMPITKRDGTKETVKVRQIPVCLMPKYAAALQDEAVMADLLCDKPVGWSVTLADASFEAVIEEGERLNDHFFGRWLERQRRRAERIAPIVERAILPITSPNSVSKPDSVSTKQ